MKEYKKYAKYKPSGVEWIGDIPDGWGCKAIKYLFEVVSGATPDSNKDEYWDGDIIWVTPADYKTDDHYVSAGRRSLSFDGYNSCSSTLVPAGSIIFSKRAPIGLVALADSELCTNQGCLSCIPSETVHSNFYYYVIRSLNSVFEMFGTGTTFKEISANAFNNVILQYPPLAEQKAIADFLDKKCEEIDKSISAINSEIDSLKAYRKSLISETVTKGLDKNAKMKPSGVEWIGEIPEGWKVSRIKDLADNTEENSFEDGDWIESPYIQDSGIRYFTSGNIGDGVFKNQGNGHISTETFHILKCKYAYPGDLVFSRLNAPYGRSCILPSIGDKYVIAVDNVILRTVNDVRFICYVTQNPRYQGTVEMDARGTAMKRISRSNLGLIKIPVPPLAEQQAIADFLDDKCEKIDKAIAVLEESAKLHEAYKKSLISEAVTGKIDVRDWKPNK